jgi:transmembrane sensor
MTRRTDTSSPNDPVLEQACSWLIELNDGEADARTREEFTEWLRRSPEHVRAYMEIAAAWEDSARLRGRHTPDAGALVAQALAESNVVPLPTHPATSPPSPVTSKRVRRLAMAACLAALAIFGTVLGSRHLLGAPTYETTVGEQRALTLPDGSVVELNSRSRIRVELSATQRIVELLEGQALFEVSQDASRPFVVRIGTTQVRAVGTQFDVYRKRSETVVTVIEGHVAVSSSLPVNAAASGRTPAASSFVSAGEQVVVTAQAVAAPKRADVGIVTAWTQRKLVFDETPLTEVVDEFNRYSTRRIVIEDPQLAGFHIRGTFPASDPVGLLELLKDRFGISVHETPTEIRISKQQKLHTQ